MRVTTLIALFALGAGNAQAAAVCSDPPALEDWIECTEAVDSTAAIIIDARDITITTTEETGVTAKHAGTGRIWIDVRESTIKTTGRNSVGIHGSHQDSPGSSEIRIISTNTDITTTGDFGWGIEAGKKGTSDGKIVVEMSGGSIMTGDAFSGTQATGILAYADSGAGDSDIRVTVKDGARIMTNHPVVDMDAQNHGVRALNQVAGTGNVVIVMEDSFIETEGHGLKGERHTGMGNITITATDGEITTKGANAHGIFGEHQGTTGNIIIRVAGVKIDTQGTGISRSYPFPATFSVGIKAVHKGEGDAEVYVKGSTITTAGEESRGIFVAVGSSGGNAKVNTSEGTVIMTSGPYTHGIVVSHAGDGNIMTTTSTGDKITVTGDNSSGIVAWHNGTTDSRKIDINVGGSVSATGVNAHGVRVGDVRNTGNVRSAAPEDDDGFRQQTVTVNGSVKGNASGVFLAGGGRVVIGRRGSIGAVSGIAILATGDTPATDPMDPPIKPKLRVDLNLGGRKVAEAIGNNWIINDGGETTIAVNNVVLHEGEKATGVTGRTAANGAWNVTMREHGVKVTNRTATDPADWVITESTDAAPIIADRDFSTQDFTETRRPRPPPSSCPDGQVGTPPDCTEPEPEPEPMMPMFMEEYAPRAALYEVLPDFMLRMQKWEPTRQRLFLPESPVYIRLLGSTGSQEFKRSTVNANYDADRFAVEAGVNIPLFENLDIWASMHHVTGSAEVSSPVNGGDIRVTGAGLSVDAYWSSENDYYATGRLSLTDYDMDLSSNTIGRLKSNGDANGQSVHVEAGRRMTLSENLHWTPRAWLGHTRISVDNFTDAVDSRVSFPDTDRLTGGFGVMAETVRTEYGGELILRGSLDFEQKLGGSKTVTLVSGERLSAEPEKSSALLSLSGAWHKGPFTYSAVLSARQDLHSGGEDYSGVIHVGMHF